MSISNIFKTSFAVSQSDTNYLLVGCYDNGSNLYNQSYAGSNKWSSIGSGDGTACEIDYMDANTVYTSSLDGFVLRQNPSTQQITTLRPLGNNTPVKLYNSIVLDPIQHKTIYMITDSSIFRSKNQGNDGTWEEIKGNLNLSGFPVSLYRIIGSETTPGALILQNLYYEDTINQKTYFKQWRTLNANALNGMDVIWEPYTYSDTLFINDIEFDPINPKCGWATIQGYDFRIKVLRFDESGWQNITYNLYDSIDFSKNVPSVVSIEYDRSSLTGRLYIGTTSGVYYLDKGTTDWKMLDGMPFTEITNLRMQYKSGRLFASTYGKGVWGTRINNTICNGDVLITQDTVILNNAMSFCNIKVQPGKTLTIKGLLTMGADTKIIVDRGAKLVLDGGKVTGFGAFMWNGIEVWGDSSRYQLNALNYQGLVQLKNNATIENARIAIATIKKSGTNSNYSYTGGIVSCTDAVFRNCTNGVVFYKYENRHPYNQTIVNNISSFTRTRFEISEEYSGIEPIGNMVELSQVRGILFKGCTFINSDKRQISNASTGIFSYNSSFNVMPTCNPNANPIPCDIAVRSSFAGLRYGIRALGAATTKTFQVKNTDFNANTCGIYASALDYISILQNTFNITKQDTAQNLTNPLGGLFTDNCKFYTIEENTFNKLTSSGGLNAKYVGLTISNSGPDNNQIYKNTFNNLDIGILAQGKNRKSGTNEGLCLRCNNFFNTIYDIAVTRPFNASMELNGIAKYQGSDTYPAGNLFTINPPTSSRNYFNLQETAIPSSYKINYCHHIDNQQYNTEPKETRNITLIPKSIPYSPDTTCASHLNSGLPSYSKMIQNEEIANEKEIELTGLVDGGETSEMVSDVIFSSPDQSLNLREQLLLQSPFLSDTLMQSAIEKENVLNNAMVRDVLVANPQSAKSQELMQKLEERIVPMPDYMKEEIADGAAIISPKEQLEADIVMGKAEAEGWYNRMIGEQLFDTTGNNGTELNNLLELRQRVSNDYFKAVANFEAGQNQTGLTTLEAIPAQYDLSSQQMLDHTKLLESYQLLSGANLNIKPVQLLDATQINAFKSHINDLGSLGDNWLRNTLVASSNLNYTEQYILPDLTKSTDIEIPQKKKSKISNEFLKVFPNPAKEYIIIEYTINNAESKNIHITDGMGRTINKLTIRKDEDQILYLTKNLKPGIYNCSLSTDGRIKASVKFTVIQ